MSYNIEAEASDDDAIFLENAIHREKNPGLKEALQDLDDFLFGYWFNPTLSVNFSGS